MNYRTWYDQPRKGDEEPFPGSPDDMMNTVASLRAQNAELVAALEEERAAFKETLDEMMKSKDRAWSEVVGSERLKANELVAALEEIALRHEEFPEKRDGYGSMAVMIARAALAAAGRPQRSEV